MNRKPNLRSEKIQSTSFLIWIISGLYLLPMVWFLLSTMVAYGAHETKPWLVPAVAALTVLPQPRVTTFDVYKSYTASPGGEG